MSKPKFFVSCIQMVVRCVNDTKPDNLVIEEDWIQAGQCYRLRGLVETAINQSDDASYLLSDMNGNPIRVSAAMKGYRSSRFVDAHELSYNLN